MNDYRFSLGGAALVARADGTLWWPAQRVLCVSDLHLGKSDRIARRSGRMLPPYESHETLHRLGAAVQATDPMTIISLGDSFDDMAAIGALDDSDMMLIASLQAGRDWIWIEGNHDPGPIAIGGRHLTALTIDGLTFRHIAEPSRNHEISGHYHPKCRVAGSSRPAFLIDAQRVIMPAFGAYTGGLRAGHPTLQALMDEMAIAVLTGRKALPVPFRATA
jgi:DNA ligase-associated metallophosphoesterase